MSIQFCHQHNLFKDFICAKNQCNQLICKQCFVLHSQTTHHYQSVQLSLHSKQFFLRWTQFLLKRIQEFSQIVQHMGYSKLFEMKLDSTHPKGLISQLDFQDIEKSAIQALQQHRRITQGNLLYIKGTTTLQQMNHPQFLQDLYNIACQDARFIMDVLLTNFKKKLVQNYKNKEIYAYTKFNITNKQIIIIEDERQKLLKQFDNKIMFRVNVNGEKNGQVKNSTETNTTTKQEQRKTTFVPSSRFSKDYSLSNQNQFKNPIPVLKKQEQNSSSSNSISEQQNLADISTRSNPSQSPKDLPQIPILNPNNQSYEQLTSQIALLRSNQQFYQKKVMNLQNQNGVLRSQIQRLSLIERKTKQLQRQNESLRSLNRPGLQVTGQVDSQYRKQIQELQKVQANLIQENRKMNFALKDLQDIAQGRSRTIVELEQQIKLLSQNVLLKQKSIQQLNQLISNQQQQINYRQNQVQILQGQIKKLLDKIAFLQKSIHQLNNLVSNQQEQISYRENEVQTLQEEIKKLLNRIEELQKSIKSLNSLIANQQEEIAYRQNQSQILEKQVKKLLDKISYLQKSIHQLNNLIANEEQEIAYRENQTQTLQNEVKKLVNKISTLQKSIHQLNNLIANEQQQIAYRQNQSQTLTRQVHLLIQKNTGLQNELIQYKNKKQQVQNRLKQTIQKSKQFENQLNQYLQQSSNIQNQLHRTQERDINLQNQLKQTYDQKQQLQSHLNMMQGEMTNLCKRNQQLQKQSNQLKIQVNGFVPIVKGLQLQIHKQRQFTQQLQKQLTMKNSQIKQLYSRLSNSTQSNTFNKQQNKMINQQLSTLQDQNKLIDNQLKLSIQKNKILDNQILLINQKCRFIQEELVKANQKNMLQEDVIATNNQRIVLLTNQVNLLKAQLLNTKAELNLSIQEINKLKKQLTSSAPSHSQQSPDQQLLQQVVMMEADLAAKTDDIDLLSNLVDEYLKSLNIKQNPSIIDKLNKLKTVRFSNYTH